MKKRICFFALIIIAVALFSLPLLACNSDLKDAISQNELKIAQLEQLLENARKNDVEQIAQLEKELKQATQALHDLRSDRSFAQNSITFSHSPGVYASAFTLTVLHQNPNAVIYYTLDGQDPVVGSSSRLAANGQLEVSDRSGPWQNSQLTSLTPEWSNLNPLNTPLLTGNAFRFRAFVDGQPVSPVYNATYIIKPEYSDTFHGVPIVSITVDQDEFVEMYKDTDPWNPNQVRHTFNYELFTFSSARGQYLRRANLQGSTNLGGTGSRGNAQRTINVSLVRGSLNGNLSYPIFNDGHTNITRFRLWNGGNSFHWCHMRDPFAQNMSSAAGLIPQRAQSRVMIKFVNGEFWGFTTMREHTSNREFTEARLGTVRGNVGIVDAGWRHGETGGAVFYHEVAEGNEGVVWGLFEQMVSFAKNNDMSANAVAEQFFDQFFCQDNFIDYFVANTFFGNTDWPHNNTRLFRALNPLDDGNHNNDGKWRFILHDMDFSPHPGVKSNYNIFERMLNPHTTESGFYHVLAIFSNRAFVERFNKRAIAVISNGLRVDALTPVFYQMRDERLALLPLHYSRFPIRNGGVEGSIRGFHDHANELKGFFTTRHNHYINHLNWLLSKAK